MVRSTHLLAFALVLGLAAAAPALAQDAPPVPLTPADGVTAPADDLPFFTGSGPGALVVRVARSPGALNLCSSASGNVIEIKGTTSPDGPEIQLFAPRPTLSPGDWYWQVVRPRPCSYSAVRHMVVTGGEAAPELPAAPVAPAAPVPKLSHAPIPLSIGRSNHAQLVLDVAGLPATVSRSRFSTLVRNSAARWRLSVRGPAFRTPKLHDGRSDIGFNGALVPPQALAITIGQMMTPVYVRTHCNAGGCAQTRTRGRSRLVEVDVAIRPDAPWQPGPAYPDASQVDLETTILHELGHAAGNGRHTPIGCHDTPMVVGLDGGEWWRSTTDWNYRGCHGQVPAAARMATARIDHEVEIER